MKAIKEAFMKRAQVLQEIRKMNFERIYTGWRAKRLTQDQAASLLGVSSRALSSKLVTKG